MLCSDSPPTDRFQLVVCTCCQQPCNAVQQRRSVVIYIDITTFEMRAKSYPALDNMGADKYSPRSDESKCISWTVVKLFRWHMSVGMQYYCICTKYDRSVPVSLNCVTASAQWNNVNASYTHDCRSYQLRNNIFRFLVSITST